MIFAHLCIVTMSLQQCYLNPHCGEREISLVFPISKRRGAAMTTEPNCIPANVIAPFCTFFCDLTVAAATASEGSCGGGVASVLGGCNGQVRTYSTRAVAHAFQLKTCAAGVRASSPSSLHFLAPGARRRGVHSTYFRPSVCPSSLTRSLSLSLFYSIPSGPTGVLYAKNPSIATPISIQNIVYYSIKIVK